MVAGERLETFFKAPAVRVPEEAGDSETRVRERRRSAISAWWRLSWVFKTSWSWSNETNWTLAAGAPLAGLTRGGYRLIYSDEPTAIFKDGERRASEVNLAYSLGLVIGKGGRVSSVVWDSPAFVAGLTSAAEIIAVNGAVYSDSVIRDAVSAAKGGSAPIRLIVRSGDRVRELAIVWNGGHRYPRLEKIAPGDAALDALLHPRL